MISEPETLARTALSVCAAFQTFVGAVDAPAALARIYRGGAPDPEEDYRSELENESLYPCAFIWTPDEGWSAVHASSGVGNRYLAGGQLMVTLSRYRDMTKTDNENYTTDRDDWSTIMEQFLGQTGPGGLSVRTVQLMQTRVSTRNEQPGMAGFDKDRNDCKELSEVTFAIEWGGIGGQ